jgi:hypothetical protein
MVRRIRCTSNCKIKLNIESCVVLILKQTKTEKNPREKVKSYLPRPDGRGKYIIPGLINPG